MRRLKIVFLVSLTLSLFSAKAQSVQEVKRNIELERIQKAKSIANELVRKEPKNPEYRCLLANVLLMTNSKDSANLIIEEGIRNNSKYALYYVAAGKINLASKRDAGAKVNFDKALAMTKSKDPEIYAAIGEAYIGTDNKNIDLAILNFETAIYKDPKNSRYFHLLGDAYYEKNDGTKAIENYKKALAMDAKNPALYLKIGNVYTRAKNFEEGIKFYKQGMEIDPDYILFYRQMGDLYYRAKQYDKAIASFKKYVDNTDKNNDNDFRFASFLYLNQDFEGALKIFNQLESKGYQNIILTRLLAYTHFDSGNTEKGLEYMDKYWKSVPEKMIISSDYEYYGKMFLKNGNDSLGILNIDKAVALDSSRVDLLSELANQFFTSQKYIQAAKQFEKKMKFVEPSAQDYLNLGKSYYYGKDFAKADSSFQLITEALPTSPTGYIWRARANYNMEATQEREKAKPFYEKVIELTSSEPEKYTKELVDSYSYLGYYYALKKDKVKSEDYWNKVLVLDPNNKYAKQVLKK
ncbi:MAG: tetratricopeptide repeat protein [Cytophagaceae bacterium]